MARTDDDTWDLASSVGATATMVAAQRALANREGLIDDPFAEPLVRAVGLDFFIRALDGEIKLEDVDPEFNIRRAAEGMAVRTRWFDKLFTDAAAAGITGTPTFILGRVDADWNLQGEFLIGAKPYAEFQRKIEAMLSERK